MKMSDMRAKARAIFGPAIAEPMPKQPNGAKALQERANARPIPTYKVGGAVKKQKPPQPTAAEREAERKRREEYAKMKVTPENAAAIGRGNRSPGYNKGGKVMPASPQQKQKTRPPRPTSDELERLYDMERRKNLNAASKTGRPSGYSSSMKTGGKVQTASDTARKLATEMGGMKKGGAMKAVDEDKNPGLKKLPEDVRNKMGYMKKGGKPKKDGLAVMIAIGSPMKGMKKPVKKMAGGMAYAKGGMACAKDGGEMMKPVKKAVGGAGKTRKGMAPIKKAQGGAAKVRKGMMTPEGKITHAMNKVRGK